MPDDTPPIVPPAPESPKSAKRPTTRAGRRAQAAAKKATADKAPKSRSSSGSSTTPRKAQLSTRLTDALVGAGLGVRFVGSAMGSDAVNADGVVIVQHAPAVGDALARVADNDPKVKAAIERVLTVSVYGQLLSALLPLALGIAANHGMVPPQLVALAGDPAKADELDRVVAAYKDTHPDATQAELEAHVLAWMQAAAGQGAAVSAPAA